MRITAGRRDALRDRGGFTLVEVLVVVAIIGLLVAILVPSLTRAKATSHEVVCRHNTHQIDLALRAYAADNHGWFPLADFELNPHRKLLDAIRADKSGLMDVMYCGQGRMMEPHAQNTINYPPKEKQGFTPEQCRTSVIDTPENRRTGNIGYFYWSHKDRSHWRSPVRGGGQPRWMDEMDSFRPRHLRIDGLPKPYPASKDGLPDENGLPHNETDPDPKTPVANLSKAPSKIWVVSDFFRQSAPFPHTRRHKSGLNVLYLDGHAAWMFGQPRASHR